MYALCLSVCKVKQKPPAALYQIVNTRLLEGRPTIISTNLPAAELKQRYSPQIASRLLGVYECYSFAGDDIRMLK